jgi:uncharacterized membrane protein (DUF485 family)
VQDEGDTLRGGESAGAVSWRDIAESPQFRELESLRRRVTLGLLGAFVVAAGTFLVLCAYARPFMRESVDGGLSIAYVWLLALTVLAWVLVWLYLRFSERRLEPMAARILERSGPAPGTGSSPGAGSDSRSGAGPA